MCVYVRTSVCECVLLMWLEKEILELQGKEQNNLFRDSWSHRRGSNKITILNPKANKIYSSTIPDARLSFDLEKKIFRACVQQDVALLLNLNVTHYIESNMFLQVRNMCRVAMESGNQDFQEKMKCWTLMSNKEMKLSSSPPSSVGRAQGS